MLLVNGAAPYELTSPLARLITCLLYARRMAMRSASRQRRLYTLRRVATRYELLPGLTWLLVRPDHPFMAIPDYGKCDFGVNRERIKAWLDILREGL